jgi:hypothetical protein
MKNDKRERATLDRRSAGNTPRLREGKAVPTERICKHSRPSWIRVAAPVSLPCQIPFVTTSSGRSESWTCNPDIIAK